MSLVPSLLQAILKVDGEALVMHAGEKPYVVAPSGQIELASRGLTLEAVDGIVGQLLPVELQRALDEFGAVQYELPAAPEFPGEHFTVVAARGGDDLWTEIRRRRVPDEDQIPEEFFPPRVAPAVAAPPPPPPVHAAPPPVAVEHREAFAYRETAIRQEITGHHEVIAYQETARYGEAVPQAESVGHLETAAYQDTMRADATVAAETPRVAEAVDDDLSLPNADELFGRRREFVPDQVVEDFGEGEEFEIDLDAQEPSMPQAASPVQAPPTHVVAPQHVEEAPPPPVVEVPEPVAELPPPIAEVPEPVAEVLSPILMAPPPAVEVPEPVAELPPPIVIEPPPPATEVPEPVVEVIAEAPPVVEAPQPVAVAEVPPPIVEESKPVPVAEAPRSSRLRNLWLSRIHRPVVEPPQPMTVTEVSSPVTASPAPPPVEAPELVAVAEVAPPVVEPEPAPVMEVLEPVAEVPPAILEAPEPVAVAEVAPVVEPEPAPVMEVPEPVAEIPPAILEAPELVAVAEVAPPAVEPEPAPVMEVPEPVADIAAPVIEALELVAVAKVLPPVVEPEPAPVMEVPELVAEMAPPAIEALELVAVAEVPPPVVEPELTPVMEVPEYVAEVPPPVVEPESAPVMEVPEPVAEFAPPVVEAPELVALAEVPPPIVEPELMPVMEVPEYLAEVPPPVVEPESAPAMEVLEPVAEVAPPVVEAPEPVAQARVPKLPRRPVTVPPPATVLPLSRNPIRSIDHPVAVADPTMSGLDRLLRVSAARGASTLYLSTDARPSVRVDGELQTIEGEPVLSARDVESLLLTLMPERSHEALRTGAATEWICDIEAVGRVRCLSFRDHRGPGGVFRLMPTRSVSVDQLGLPRSVQALAIEQEGLVLVAGPRSSGKRTLLSAFVDQINKTRRDHVITIEREINIVHASGTSFISQREVRGNDDDMLTAARAALREDPDVLVIEDLRTEALMNVALEAAAAGRLVVGGFAAHTAAGAIDRIIDLYPAESRGQVQLALADSLRGVIVQVLLRKTGGGRVPAREVLLNTPAVSSAIAEGKTSQLAMAIEGGRRYGMMPINDELVALVKGGVVDAREAYRRSTDRPGFLAALKRNDIDTSFVERLA